MRFQAQLQPARPADAAQAGQTDWQAGRHYRALVTSLRAGQAEILIGNRYLNATTALPLSQGQSLLLELFSAGQDGLVFRLLQGRSGGEAALADNSAVLLKAAGLPASAAEQGALTLLERHSISASAQALRQTSLLIDSLGMQRAAAFMPELRAYFARGLSFPDSILLQIAFTATASTYAEALAPYDGGLGRRGQRGRRQRRPPPAPLELREAEGGPPDIRSHIATLFGSPEHALLTTLVDNTGAQDTQAEIELPLQHGGSARLGDSEDVLADWAEAQRIRAVADSEALRLTLPLSLEGEPASLAWEQHDLGVDFYEREQLLRLKLLNATQGRVDIMLHAKGASLRLDVASESQEVVEAYKLELAQLEFELRAIGLSLGSTSATRQVLPT